ncbi:MAG: PAS domain-containing protein [Syntrophobacterales bacterium]|jgi:signal transduction histidine kinase
MERDEQIIHLVKDLYNSELARAVLATVREPFVILDGQMRIKWASASFYTNFRLKPEETLDCLIYELDEGRWDIREVHEFIDEITHGRGRVTDHEFAHHFKGIGHRTLNLNANAVFSESGDPQLVLLAIQDITEKVVEGGGQEKLFEHIYDRAVHLEKAKEELRSEIIEQLEQNNVMVQAQEELEKSEEERAAELVVAKELIKEEIIEHQETEDALKETGRTVQRLSSRLLFAIENERKSIAMELHDSIGANLTAIIYGLEEMLEWANQQQVAELQDLISMVRATVDETRRISTNLMPAMLDDLGLLATLRWFCRQFQQLHGGVEIELQLQIEEADVTEQLKIVIYRILQEALNNVAKHSRADSVQVSLSNIGDELELYIQDNGRGFDLGDYSVKEGFVGGLGLESMRERTEISGGSFKILSDPGEGTIIRARWPTTFL